MMAPISVGLLCKISVLHVGYVYPQTVHRLYLGLPVYSKCSHIVGRSQTVIDCAQSMDDALAGFQKLWCTVIVNIVVETVGHISNKARQVAIGCKTAMNFTPVQSKEHQSPICIGTPNQGIPFTSLSKSSPSPTIDCICSNCAPKKYYFIVCTQFKKQVPYRYSKCSHSADRCLG